jgi:hypothetical protein
MRPYTGMQTAVVRRALRRGLLFQRHQCWASDRLFGGGAAQEPRRREGRPATVLAPQHLPGRLADGDALGLVQRGASAAEVQCARSSPWACGPAMTQRRLCAARSGRSVGVAPGACRGRHPSRGRPHSRHAASAGPCEACAPSRRQSACAAGPERPARQSGDGRGVSGSWSYGTAGPASAVRAQRVGDEALRRTRGKRVKRDREPLPSNIR